MERINYACYECDNECCLSIRGDSADVPEDCPIDAHDGGRPPEWELDEEVT
jgi:hypothetical protein